MLLRRGIYHPQGNRMNVKELGRQEQNWERSDLVALNATNTAELGAQRPGRVECHKRSGGLIVLVSWNAINTAELGGQRAGRVGCLKRSRAGSVLVSLNSTNPAERGAQRPGRVE